MRTYKESLRCALVTDCVTIRAGGLYNSVSSLGKALRFAGVDAEIFGGADVISTHDRGHWAPLKLNLIQVRGPRSLGWIPGMTRELLRSGCELAHTQGIWQGASVGVLRWTRATGKPHLVSPRGMLDPWALANSSWKKKIASVLYEDSHLQSANCVHCLSESEAESVRSYGLKNPICVIPNGIDLPEARGQGPGGRSQGTGKKQLLFLGRLHPKKGLVNALRAWAKIKGQGSDGRDQEEWQFVIAGWDQGGHQADLKRLCKELGLSYSDVPAAEFLGDPLAEQGHPAAMRKSEMVIDTPLHSKDRNTGSPASVVFTGPAFGATKDQLLRRASAFILPSFSEGLPMSVLEAWSYQLPVVMTDECNLPEGFAAEAAIRIGTDVESIAEGLRLLLRSPISDLQSLGGNGRQLVSERFTWPQIAAQMKEVYDWVLGGGDKPSIVV